jgi:hypothetical protein
MTDTVADTVADTMEKTISETEKSVFNINNYADIKLYFPDSISSESLIKEFILSKNDIRQSGFLGVLLENMDDNDNNVDIDEDDDENIMITKNQIRIPSSLYKGIRYIDLVYFIDLWKGKESLTEYSIIDNKNHNLKSIKKLCDSLLLNTELYFVKKLMNLFPHNE